MDQTWCPVCPVAVKGELLRCNEATAEQGLSLTIQDWEELQAGRRAALADTGRVEFGLGIVTWPRPSVHPPICGRTTTLRRWTTCRTYFTTGRAFAGSRHPTGR